MAKSRLLLGRIFQAMNIFDFDPGIILLLLMGDTRLRASLLILKID